MPGFPAIGSHRLLFLCYFLQSAHLILVYPILKYGASYVCGQPVLISVLKKDFSFLFTYHCASFFVTRYSISLDTCDSVVFKDLFLFFFIDLIQCLLCCFFQISVFCIFYLQKYADSACFLLMQMSLYPCPDSRSDPEKTSTCSYSEISRIFSVW